MTSSRNNAKAQRSCGYTIDRNDMLLSELLAVDACSASVSNGSIGVEPPLTNGTLYLVWRPSIETSASDSCVRPAGFVYAAVESSESPRKAPPMPRLRAPGFARLNGMTLLTSLSV